MKSSYDIEVSVEAAYLPEQSEPADERYVFSYTITLINRGAMTAQLKSRHWIIIDADNKVEEVKGDGVVGERHGRCPGRCPLRAALPPEARWSALYKLPALVFYSVA